MTHARRRSSVRRHAALFLLAAAVLGCDRKPNREEAAAAIRAADPRLDSATVTGRVWQDGPPWFSCAEVLAKVGTTRDRAVVRDQVGNWRSLIMSGVAVVHDSAFGVVSDPGWCTLKLTPQGEVHARGWQPIAGPPFPTGTPRRGWTMPVGRQRISVVDTHPLPGDTARADFLVTVAVNASGQVLGAARDTARYTALLVRTDGAWHVIDISPAASAAGIGHANR